MEFVEPVGDGLAGPVQRHLGLGLNIFRVKSSSSKFGVSVPEIKD